MQALADQSADVPQGQLAPGRRRRVVDGEAADVAVRGRALDRQELRVERRQLPHTSLLPGVTTSYFPDRAGPLADVGIGGLRCRGDAPTRSHPPAAAGAA